MSVAATALATALAALGAPAPIQSGPLSLDEALGIAERNAFSIKIRQSEIEKNRQREAEARANMGPKVSVTANYTRYTDEQTTSFGGGPPTVIRPIDSKSLGAQLSMPIDIAGNLRRLLNAARETTAASRHSLRATVNDVRLNTKQAYFNVLRQNGLLKVAEQSLLDAKERLDQANKLFKGDQIAKVDVMRFETQVSQAEADLIAARNNLQLAQQQFNLTLARPIETPVELAPISELPPVASTADGLVQIAEKQRPEVLAFGDTLEALANLRRAQEAGMNPSLGFTLNHQRNIDAAGFSASSQTTFGTLLLSLPVFDSGLTRARVKQSRQDEEQARINLSQLKLGISQEVRTALANLAGARSRLENAEAQVKLAEEVYRLAKVKQDAGAGVYVEVIDAETVLTQARNALVAARYDYLANFAQLQRAVGSDTLSANATTPGGTK